MVTTTRQFGRSPLVKAVVAVVPHRSSSSSSSSSRISSRRTNLVSSFILILFMNNVVPNICFTCTNPTTTRTNNNNNARRRYHGSSFFGVRATISSSSSRILLQHYDSTIKSRDYDNNIASTATAVDNDNSIIANSHNNNMSSSSSSSSSSTLSSLLPPESSRDRRTRLWIEKIKEKKKKKRATRTLKQHEAVAPLTTKGVRQKKRRRRRRQTSSSSSLPTISSLLKNYQINDKHEARPWNATISTSKKTQALIKKVVDDSTSSTLLILKTLFDADPNSCNEVNLVYALTASAKCLASTQSKKDELVTQEYVTRALTVVEELLREGRFSGRQRANVAWSLSKYHSSSNDETLLTRMETILYGDLAMQLLNEDLLGVVVREEEVDVTMTERQQQPRGPLRLQPEELCMTAWAYATIRPRGTIVVGGDGGGGGTDDANDSSLSSRAEITFERANDVFFYGTDDSYDDDDGIMGHTDDETSKDDDDDKETVTNTLLKSIGMAFCEDDPTTNDDSLLRQCTWKELSTLSWSYATARRHHDDDDDDDRRYHHHDRDDLAIKSEQFLMELTTEVIRRLRSLSPDDETSSVEMVPPLPRDVSLIVWSLGVLQQRNYHLANHLIELINALSNCYDLPSKERPLERWKPTDLIQLAVSLARSRIDHDDLLVQLFSEAERQVNDFRSWELSGLLWVQAKLHLVPRGSSSKDDDVYRRFPSLVVSSLLSRTTKTNDDDESSSLPSIGINSHEQANLAWSLTILEHYTPSSILLLRRIFSSPSHPPHRDRHAHQLYQSYLILSRDCPDAVSTTTLPLLSHLETRWNDEKMVAKRSSSRHESLSQTLNFMGVAHYNEYEDDIDVAIVLKRGSVWTSDTADDEEESGDGGDGDDEDVQRRYHDKVAVEFDGPDHFTRVVSSSSSLGDDNDKKKIPRALGQTVLKYRLLKKKGWMVIRVPYYEFDKIPFWASMERQRYLQRKLKTHANIRFSNVDVSEYKAMLNNRQSRFD